MLPVVHFRWGLRTSIRATHLRNRPQTGPVVPLRTYSTPALTITERCAEMINKLTQQDWVKDKANAKLRIIVDSGGCSGYTYDFSLDDKAPGEEDVIFEKDSAKVIVDKESLRHLSGAVIDWKEEMIRRSFVVSENPNAATGCSCGSSFASKVDS